MQHPYIEYYVTREDESKGDRTNIPTTGLAASYFDAYRTVGVHSIANKPASWCLTDTETTGALGRVIDGPIRSYQDIEQAEKALRAMLLNDYLQVLVPCIKAEHDNGYVVICVLMMGKEMMLVLRLYNKYLAETSWLQPNL